MKPKAWQLDLFWPRRNVEPRQHSGRLLDDLQAHATAVAFVVEDFQTAMSKAADHGGAYIVAIVTCQQAWGPEEEFVVSGMRRCARPGARWLQAQPRGICRCEPARLALSADFTACCAADLSGLAPGAGWAVRFGIGYRRGVNHAMMGDIFKAKDRTNAD